MRIDHINMEGQSPPRLSYIILTVIWQAEEAHSLADFEEGSQVADYYREQCLRNNIIGVRWQNGAVPKN